MNQTSNETHIEKIFKNARQAITIPSRETFMSIHASAVTKKAKQRSFLQGARRFKFWTLMLPLAAGAIAVILVITPSRTLTPDAIFEQEEMQEWSSVVQEDAVIDSFVDASMSAYLNN